MKKFFIHMRVLNEKLCDRLALRHASHAALALLQKTKRSVQRVASGKDKVFYHIFLTCKCFMVVNVRWLHSLFYTIAQTCGSSYTQN